MDIKEIQALIDIKYYLVNAVNNFNIDKTKIHQLMNLVSLVDKKLVDALLSDDFKHYVGFEEKPSKIPNVKSGM